jgi:hypothetical protein
MKKLISILSIFMFVGVVATTAQPCKSETNGQPCASSAVCADNPQTNAEVKAYYFHATRRCATCQAVESVTKDALKEYYGDKVSFESINRETEKDNDMVKKYQISGTTLLIIKGKKSVDLTNEAFLNARTDPEKFKTKLKSTIDSLL